MPSANKMAPLLLVDFSPKLRCSSKACVMSPWHTDSTDGRRHGPIPKGLAVGMTKSRAHGGTQSRPLRMSTDAPEAPPKDGATSSPLTPLALRRPSFNRP
jgi:hypothetical protein